MESIHKALKREIRLKMALAIAMIVFGEVLCIYTFQNNVFLTVIGLLCLIFGVKMVYDNYRFLKIEKTPLLHILAKQPEKIVWVYSMLTQRMPFGIEFSRMCIIYFKLIDGDEITVSIPVKALEPTMKTLNRRLRHATFGYSKDREQWFMAEPALLLRDEEGD